MNDTIVVAGRISDPTHIELDLPITGMEGRVEIILRTVPAPTGGAEDIFNLIANLSPGNKSKAQIDEELRAERASWD